MDEMDMKLEAIDRMKILELHRNAIREFRDEGKLNVSEPQRIGHHVVGMLYWLNEKHMKLIGDWQEESGNLVYHVVHSFTEFGELLDCLYVSKYPEEWEEDRRGLDFGEAISHSINLTAPECSESGYIGVKKAYGGVLRTW